MTPDQLRLLAATILEEDARNLPPGWKLDPATSDEVGEWLTSYLDSPDVQVISDEGARDTPSMAWWRLVPWDSALLGCTVARLERVVSTGSADRVGTEPIHRLIGKALAQCEASGVDYLLARVPAASKQLVQALQSHSFQVIDGIITLARATSSAAKGNAPEGFEIREATLADSQSLEPIAANAFTLDRYHQDPAIPVDLADEAHRQWLRNSITGEAAAAVFTAVGNAGPCGFVTCSRARLQPYRNEEAAVIGLVATAAGARGKGIASALTMEVVHWAAEQQLHWVFVGTQVANVGALRLYEGCGFRTVQSAITFRKLLRER